MYTLEEQMGKLKKNVKDIILLGYGGSYAYGTNVESSDIDLRGIYRNPIEEIMGNTPDSEQYVDDEYDTSIYSLKKMIKLLSECNPNTIEILGLRERDYLVMTEEGRMLVDNASIFLSKKAIYRFAGYANSQLNRFVNRTGRAKDEITENEVRSIEKVLNTLKNRYPEINRDEFRVYNEDGIIYLDMKFEKMPVESIIKFMNEINNVHKDYKKSRRNDKAVEHDKISKHLMHLIRLFMMGIDIIDNHEIRTFREGAEHDLLMRIRNDEFVEADKVTPTQELKELISEYEAKFWEASKRTTLPDYPDYEKINSIVIEINRRKFLR